MVIGKRRVPFLGAKRESWKIDIFCVILLKYFKELRRPESDIARFWSKMRFASHFVPMSRSSQNWVGTLNPEKQLPVSFDCSQTALEVAWCIFGHTKMPQPTLHWYLCRGPKPAICSLHRVWMQEFECGTGRKLYDQNYMQSKVGDTVICLFLGGLWQNTRFATPVWFII